jgi:hypothetical protein
VNPEPRIRLRRLFSFLNPFSLTGIEKAPADPAQCGVAHHETESPAVERISLNNMELFETKLRHLANYYVGIAVLAALIAAAMLAVRFTCR